MMQRTLEGSTARDHHRIKRWFSIQLFKLLTWRRRARKTTDFRVLILEFGHIGDAVLLLPLLRHLEESRRIAAIDVVGGAWLAPVLALGCRRTRFIPQPHPKARREKVGLSQVLKDTVALAWTVVRGRYDVCVESKGALNSVVFAFLSRAPWLLGTDWYRKGYPFDSVSASNHDYEARRKLGLVAALDLGVAEAVYRLSRNETDEAFVAGALAPLNGRRFLMLHVSCPWPPRLWPATRQRELLMRLLAADPDLHVILIGTAADRPAVDALRTGVGARVHDYCGRFTLGQLVAVARQAALYLGSDSGPAHLAAAAGGRLVILLGPAEHPRFAPYNPEAKIVCIRHEVCTYQRENSCNQILSQSVCAMGDNICMKAITVDEVFAGCMELLQANP